MKLICSALLLAVAQASRAIYVGSFGSYPGYAGDVKAVGMAYLIWKVPGVVEIQYATAGTEPECSQPSDAVNSCGIHIHEGRGCETATAPGGHYYNTSSDPWAQIRYNGVGVVTVPYGHDYDSTIGRTLVVHDRSGARVTCAIIDGRPAVAQAKLIQDTIVVRDLGNYPGYAGNVKAKGTARLTWNEPRGVEINYKITGVEAECSEPSDAANSCGIHIHAGRSCENATSPGGDFFNSTSDSWAGTRYVASGSVAVGRVFLRYGYTYEATIGRALVVHDRSGARVTCALLIV